MASPGSQLGTSFDAVASTTLQNYQPTLQDNIFKKNPFFYWMLEKGAKMTVDGGRTIVVPITYAKNSTVAPYASYGIIDTTPQDNETAAEYGWSQYAGSIAISGKEMRQNSGSKTKLINLLEAKTKNAENAMREKLDIDLFGAQLTNANGDNGLNGLQSLVDTTSVVGNINSTLAANSFWDAQTTASGSFATQGLDNMRTTYNNCTIDGMGGPDLGLTTQTIFEYYEKGLQTQQRFTDTKTLDGGFENLKFKGMTLMWDSKCNSGTMYFLNSDALKLAVHPDGDLKVTDFIKPGNQDAKVANILFMGNTVVLERRRLGKMTSVTA